MSPSKRNRVRPQPETIAYGNMDWFEVAEQPEAFKELPKEFKTAYDLWKKGAEEHHDKIAELLSPYVIAKFLPANISGWEELFADPDGHGQPEFAAVSVRVAGVDFSATPIPKCKAEAIFRVPVTEGFGECEDFDTWQEENDYFASGISFGWNVPRTAATEEIDLMFGDHSGCECVVEYQGVEEDWPGVSVGPAAAGRKTGRKKTVEREAAPESTESAHRTVIIKGLTPNDRQQLVELLREGYQDELANLPEIEKAAGDTITALLTEDGLFMLKIAVRAMKGNEEISESVSVEEG